MGRIHPATWIAIAALPLEGCTGQQSALSPAGPEASSIALLFQTMAWGAAVIWVLVVSLAVYATRVRPRPHSERGASRLIIWGGAVIPTVILTILLSFALWLMPGLRDAPAEVDLRIEVVGEQFWWRVHYQQPGSPEFSVASANEIRIPVGRPVEFVLSSNDVIHSFWIPSLAGKVDMIPGRTNRLTLQADAPGVYRGACAEFCGASHALMALIVVALEPEAFSDWLAGQAEPAEPVRSEGYSLFLANGCGACHTVRGTPAEGRIGPDLTHIGSRRTIAAVTLPNDTEALQRFIAAPQEVKPGAQMPAYSMLSGSETAAIATWLRSLE